MICTLPAPARKLKDQHGRIVEIPAGSPAAVLLDPRTYGGAK